ncbi:MAG: sulfur carrier protein ThiS [Heliobacteriaceae bacterium]|nr:sulfur carrier protein ThiS [Heliobacteriaceae bacterium]
MVVSVNGRPVDVESGCLLHDFLTGQKVDPDRVVVEHNQRIVPQSEWAGIILQAGDVLEIVAFVGGG